MWESYRDNSSSNKGALIDSQPDTRFPSVDLTCVLPFPSTSPVSAYPLPPNWPGRSLYAELTMHVLYIWFRVEPAMLPPPEYPQQTVRPSGGGAEWARSEQYRDWRSLCRVCLISALRVIRAVPIVLPFKSWILVMTMLWLIVYIRGHTGTSLGQRSLSSWPSWETGWL